MTNINKLDYVLIVNEFCSIRFFFSKLYITSLDPLLCAR